MSERVAVVGGGSIGVAFAIVWARGGRQIAIFEPDTRRRSMVRAEILRKLEMLAESGLVVEPVAEVESRVTVVDTLEDAVSGAVLVQECVPEKVELKTALFAKLAVLTGPDTVLASSSSAIVASESAGGVSASDRVLVAHPGNPPYLLPVIELVPSSETRKDIVSTANRLYLQAGMSPVVVHREVEGFIFNRLQGAVLREAYALVRDGVASVADIDTVMRDGLGRRWSFMGPFETVDLNTRGGIASHAEKMGPAYERMGTERGQHDPWTPDLVAEVVRQRRELLPLASWEERVAWRDRQLVKIEVQRQELD
jgi:L-gulonate 3-dehydrogenase